MPDIQAEQPQITKAQVLELIDPPLREVYSQVIDLGWHIEISQLHKVDLPVEPVYKWTQKVSAWGLGPVLQSFNENGAWLDLFRLISNPTFLDEDAKETILEQTEDLQTQHFRLGVNYSAYKMKHFTDYIYAKRDSDLAAATAAHVPAAKISEYKVFIKKVLKGYSPVDFAIDAGASRYETAKALLVKEDVDREDGATKKSFACKSLWVSNLVSLEPANKDTYDSKVKASEPAYNINLKTHSKFAIAVGSGNSVIAKFIVHECEYVPTELDFNDIAENFPARAVAFADSLDAGDAIEGGILDQLALVGISPNAIDEG